MVPYSELPFRKGQIPPGAGHRGGGASGQWQLIAMYILNEMYLRR